jgi:hydrogenase maturation protein HypF
MSIKTVEINITGIVQGVGFRPFLFNFARDLDLKGIIRNVGNAGVKLWLRGELEAIKQFIYFIRKTKPRISHIDDIFHTFYDNEEFNKEWSNKSNIPIDFNELKILESQSGRGSGLTLPPDITICDNCLQEMRDPKKKRYFSYPFIACALCGPRFTTVTQLPYDRERTTMKIFPYCDNCMAEYTNFDDRRFHAQTFACSECGPNYILYDKMKKILLKDSIKEMLQYTSEEINNGKVIAVKGIGGVHLVCRADDDKIVQDLRNRKGGRKFKPFALMIPNIEIISDEFLISDKEEEELTSFRRPIVLIERKNTKKDISISNWIAPGLNNIGFMLPYAGIHYLLFDYIGKKPLIYTSGNRSSIPMGIENDTIFEQLGDLADYFLLHNRPIHQRVDDSVLRIHNKKLKIIRRSRGFIPEYLRIPFHFNTQGALATGPLLSNTGAILRGNRIFPTQHIGNVTNLETHEFLKDALNHMKNLLQIKDNEIEFIASDAHPEFITTKLAEELGDLYNCKAYRVQHHFAHLLGLMAENRVLQEEKIVGISTDGVGYGGDGNIWGGEVLLTSYWGYERVGHLEYQPMIGSDRCTKYPARMFASIILKELGVEEATKIFDKIYIKYDLEYDDTELSTMISQFTKAKNVFPSENIPLTSSTGRIFDVISYLLCGSKIKTYRGEPAMRLEGLASSGKLANIELKVEINKQNNKAIINTSKLVLDVLNLLKDKNNKKSDIAAKFQIELALAFSTVAKEVAELRGLDKIGLTGGVAYNYSFSKTIKDDVISEGFKFLEHNRVAPGDAGISSGQLIGGLFQFIKDN